MRNFVTGLVLNLCVINIIFFNFGIIELILNIYIYILIIIASFVLSLFYHLEKIG